MRRETAMNLHPNVSGVLVAILGGAAALVGCNSGDRLAADELEAVVVTSSPAAVGPAGTERLQERAMAQAPLSPRTRPAKSNQSRETAVVRASERVSPVRSHRPRSAYTAGSRARDPFWDDFFPFGSFGIARGRTTTSQRCAFVRIGVRGGTAAGIILTNDHVVRGAEQILVTFPDGRDAEATVDWDQMKSLTLPSCGSRTPGSPRVPLGRTSDLTDRRMGDCPRKPFREYAVQL